MQHAGMASTMAWTLTGVPVLAVMYVAVTIVRAAWRKVSRRVKSHWGESGAATALSIDEHIAGQWADGRRRLDSLLRLIGKMGVSLEQDVETLQGLDPANPRYEREARRRVAPTLRRFTFDKHLRDECRMLVPLLQFCGKDLADSQGLDTAEQLRALASLQVAIESAVRD
jgi:hypothetical protein